MIGRTSEPTGTLSNDAELARVLEDYLSLVEAGEFIDEAEFLRDHAAAGPQLRECLESLRLVRRATAEASAGQKLAANANDLQHKLGDYLLVREIGRGGMGIVYEASQMSLGRHVALKVLPFAGLLDERQLKRFRNESRAAAALDHRHIVQVHAVGYERGLHFYAMELIDGPSLAEIIARLGKAATTSTHGAEAHAGVKPSAVDQLCQQRRSDRQAYYRSVARFGVQAALALHCAHENGIVHRDVKPANLLVNSKGTLFITDFGLATMQREDGLTISGDMLGTLRYMSPEQASGQIVDHRTDVYSLGLSLYELLVLRPAVLGEDRGAILKKIDSSDPPMPRKFDAAIPRDLENIVRKAGAKERDHRYVTALAMADDLQRFLEHKPVQARSVTLHERLLRWGRRNPVVALLLVTCIGVLIAGLAGTTTQWVRAERHASEARQRATDLKTLLYSADTNNALRDLELGNIVLAETRLSRHIPGDGSDADSRGFGWFYAWNICQQGLSAPMFRPGITQFDLAISPDNRYLATSGSGDRLLIWDLDTRQQRHALPTRTGEIMSLVFSPDGSYLVTGGWSGKLEIWDTKSWNSVQVLGGHEDLIRCLRFSRDGNWLLSCSYDRTARIWDFSTRQTLHTLSDHSPGVECGAISPDSRFVVTANWSGQLNWWDRSTGRRLMTVQAHEGKVCWVEFSPREPLLATCGYDGWVRFWAEVSDRPEHEIQVSEQSVTRIAFSPLGGRIAAGSGDNFVRLYELFDPDPFATHRGHAGLPQSLVWRTDGKQLLSGSFDRSIRVWDVEQPGVQDALSHNCKLLAVAVDPQNKTVAAGGEDRIVHLWDSELGNRVAALRGHADSVTELDFSADGKWLASGSTDRSVYIWDGDQKKEVRMLRGHQGGITALAFSRLEAHTLAVGDTTGAVTVWNTATGRRFSTAAEHDREVFSVAFSPTQHLLATGDTVGNLKLIEWKSGQTIWQQRDSGGAVSAIDFSNDGSLLATGCHDQLVRVIDVVSGEVLCELPGHAGMIKGVAFTPDPRQVISVANDATVRVWNWQDGGHHVVLGRHGHEIRDLAISSDGALLATAGFDKKVRLWRAKRDR